MFPTAPLTPAKMPALEIVKAGNPGLRQVAQKVTDFGALELHTLIEQLLATVQTANGVGIAAPQTGRSLRLIVVASRPNPRYPDAPLMEPTVMINPRILSASGGQVKGWEGCLSVPGWRGLVPRDRTVAVQYLDRTGQSNQQVFSDFVARIIQHELDHLEGKLFLDRITDPNDLITEQVYQAQHGQT